jgi:hypothetical protein
MPPIQGFQLTTEDSEFELPDPPETYVDNSGNDYVTNDGHTKYETNP